MVYQSRLQDTRGGAPRIVYSTGFLPSEMYPRIAHVSVSTWAREVLTQRSVEKLYEKKFCTRNSGTKRGTRKIICTRKVVKEKFVPESLVKRQNKICNKTLYLGQAKGKSLVGK